MENDADSHELHVNSTQHCSHDEPLHGIVLGDESAEVVMEGYTVNNPAASQAFKVLR